MLMTFLWHKLLKWKSVGRTPCVKVVLSCKSLSHRLVDERFMTEIRHHPQLRMLSDDNKLCMKLGLFKLYTAERRIY